jgi:phosphate-selective porin OprO and OprP
MMSMTTRPVRLLATLALLVSGLAGADAADTSFSWTDGLEIDFGEKRSIALGARVHYDVVSFDDDVTALENDSDFRRARLEAAARYGDVRARADYDFGITEGWRSLYLEYTGFDRQAITLGQHVAPFSLDDLTGSNDLAFLERSLAGALSPSMLLGASWRGWGRNWTAAAGVFGDEIDDLDRRRMDGRSLLGRITFAPFGTGRQMLHLGLSQEFRSVDDDAPVRLRSRPETRLADARLVDTGNIAGVDDVRTTWLEILGLYDGLRVQGEYSQLTLDGNAVDADFSGGYVMVSVLLTGERYRYSGSRGVVRGIRPRGDWGALETSVRYSVLDLTDGGITGGEQSQWTVALSWYYNEQLRVNLGYSLYDADPNRRGVMEDGSVIMLRLQASL